MAGRITSFEQLTVWQESQLFAVNIYKLTKEENQAIDSVKQIIKKQDMIACTACRYCIDGCPKNIMIPDIFACYNSKKQYKDWNSSMYYNVSTNGKGKASDCIECGQCEAVCPQKLPIREYLKEVAKELEK